MTEWLRLWHGTSTDAKLSMIAKKVGARRCEMTAFFECLLDHASQHSERGHVADIDLELVSFTQEIDLDVLQNLYAEMVRKGVIINERLASWDKRQPKREDGAAERAKAWRERNKDQANATERTRTPRTEQNRTEQSTLSLRSRVPRVTLETLSVDHIADWLAEKRSKGKYVHHDAEYILETFRDYCRAKGKRYTDYVAGLRNAFEWDRCQPKHQNGARPATAGYSHQPTKAERLQAAAMRAAVAGGYADAFIREQRGEVTPNDDPGAMLPKFKNVWS